jgi:dTDP-4-dehydrorhamnose 3,5-epimerase-like enzyme
VTCAQGELDDVVVDVRVGSPTYGEYEVITLKANEGRSVLVPAGVAHGFVVTSDAGTIVYLLSSPYDPGLELAIDALDPAIGVPWRLSGEPVRSAVDAVAPLLAERRAAGELPIYLA